MFKHIKTEGTSTQIKHSSLQCQFTSTVLLQTLKLCTVCQQSIKLKNLEDQADIPLRLQTLHTTFGQSDLSVGRDQRKYLLKALFATNSEQKCQNSKL